MEGYLTTHSKTGGFAPTKKATSRLANDRKTARYMEMREAGDAVFLGARQKSHR